MAERQFGPYRLIRQIAVGGMAEIHLAKTAGIAGFEKYVALKMIHPNFAEDDQFIQMLVDEAKIAVQLTHGNIAQTFDLGRVGETYYITMEYVDGADLYKILRRASEQDIEMPLDVCAFIGKEVASALDHAHRKRDHTGRSLGIVHRDVSPQNVLVSYSGEVKLVDFGIAKATMKVRQTAVGVIKGKYYYMSPEQALGEPLDLRADVFSAGIVLYELLSGQMLYLEEDLHKLLEMARSAEIRPPSVLRRGVPPQLERIVMHALAKVPGERYQSASDLATDLERFLHAYSPVFTASKLSNLVRQVVGDPIQVPDDPGFASIEFRDGVMSTHPLDDSELVHAGDELRDENSVIFRVAELGKQAAEPAARRARWPNQPPQPAQHPRQPTPRPSQPPARSSTPPRASTPPPTPPAVRQSAPRVTRATDSPLSVPAVPVRPSSSAKVPSIVPPRASGKLPQVKPRMPDEDTRQLESPAPANPLHDDTSGLLTTDGDKLWDDLGRLDPGDDLDGIGERTLITGAPGMPGIAAGGFMMDVAADGEQIEVTLVTSAPTGPDFAPEVAAVDSTAAPSDDDDDGPTLSRDFALDHPTKPARPKLRAEPPAALAANIHAPAVSELRRPRTSRRTPPGGSPPNVLQAIVGARAGAPMPAPRSIAPPTPPPSATHATVAMPPQPAMPGMPGMLAQPPQSTLQGMSPPVMMPQATTPPPMIPSGPQTPTDPYLAQFPVGTPGAQPSYNHDASGLPMGLPTPPGVTLPAAGMTVQPGVPYPPPFGYPHQLATEVSPHGYPQMSPGALYHFQPTPQPTSLTGQMRLLEVDEIPSQFKIGSAGRRWFTYIVSGILAVSVAAGVTFLIIRSTREPPPTMGSVHLESVPSGAEVIFDGTRLTDRTPLTIDGAPVGTRHTITIVLPHYAPHTETIDIPKNGREVSIIAQLASITGKIPVNTMPAGAEVRINGQVRGVTPTVINDVDIESTRTIELRHKDFPPHEVILKWTADGRAPVDYRFTH